MSANQQIRLIVTPLPHLIAWEIRDGERRLGHGSEKLGDWSAVRGVELRAGLSRVCVKTEYMDDAGRLIVLGYGWEIAA